jgi:hypothetical protein
MTLEDLLIVEQIRTLKAKYCYYLDLQDWDGYAGLFTLDASLITDTASWKLRHPKRVAHRVRANEPHQLP